MPTFNNRTNAIISARGRIVDATQEMIAVGICNFIGSFFKSYPVNASFARGALGYASGIQTPLAGIYSGMVSYQILRNGIRVYRSRVPLYKSIHIERACSLKEIAKLCLFNFSQDRTTLKIISIFFTIIQPLSLTSFMEIRISRMN